MKSRGAPKSPIPIFCKFDRLATASELKAHPDNAHRQHPEKQLELYQRIISGNGWRKAVVVSKRSGFIIKGHGAWMIAARCGWQIPIELQPYASLAEERRDLIADNRLAQDAVNDEEKLARLLSEMDAGDVALAGYDENELAGLLSELEEKIEDAEPQIDQAKELAAKWKVKRGQIWELGKHRLMCADCTAASDVEALLNGDRPNLCVTDPPYGVNYDPSWRTKAAENGHLAYAARRVGKVPNDDVSDWRAAWELFPGDVIYSWHPAGAPSLVHAKALQDSGFVIRIQIIWAKSNFPIGRGDYHVRHEPCWYAVRKGRPANRTEDRTQTTLWEINLDKNCQGGHSTQKPLECMARPIRNHEPCEVCEQLGRKCRAMEIDPGYVAVAIQRWVDATGGKPKRPLPKNGQNGASRARAANKKQTSGNVGARFRQGESR